MDQIVKAYKKFFSRAKSTDFKRIHICNKELSLDDFEDEDQKSGSKPKGLWYGHNDSWIEWCSYEMPHWLHPYIYEIIIDDDQVYKITNVKEFEAFEEEFAGIPIEVGALFELELASLNLDILSNYYIDYAKLSEKYGGIEIIPYLYEKRYHRNSFWYYGWDVASGCVFKKSAIKEVRFLAKFDADKGKFIKI